MPYDIASVTREIQTEFQLVHPTGRDEAGEIVQNKATPENVGHLLAALQVVTNELQRQRISTLDEDFYLGGAPGGMAAWDEDFDAWKHRLRRYKFEVGKAPPGDRKDILWSVTAPLLLGYFGGENSEQPQQPIDAVTPFILANQLGVADAWREERLDLFLEDLEKGANDIASKVGIGAGAVALALLAGLLIARR